MHDLVWPVRTERLLLRPSRPDDAAALLGYRSLPGVAEWIGGPVPTLANTEEYLSSEAARHVLHVERDGVLVGDVMVMVGDAWAQTEVRERARATQATLGWVLDPRHGRQGLATEMVRGVIDLCFTPVADGGLGLRRVVAECFSDNESSWRLMERLGMRREAHHVADSLHRERGWLDEFVYALLAEEWLSRGGRP
ncbi:GNAT family N-acetyltransferase [Nocardioides sp. CBS4Y-1]|uniref:GNAT family N-acetyltransferase n=1 Tax=Nocardioides acrostichi TaxID=2784339 RepID=A0A930YC62_9ACTN|nr:GNAT family N-acetyltransferase [Nocardioides acrostichi]